MVNYQKIDDMIDEAYGEMDFLNQEYIRRDDGPVKESAFASLTWMEDGLWRRLEAVVDESEYEMSVSYTVFQDEEIEDTDDEMVRRWMSESTGDFAHPTEAIATAVRKAYQEALEIGEDQLERTDIIDAENANDF